MHLGTDDEEAKEMDPSAGDTSEATTVALPRRGSERAYFVFVFRHSFSLDRLST